ncbi:MAG: hypothetical protein ACHP84_05275 [Caulobacterales bacterium]
MIHRNIRSTALAMGVAATTVCMCVPAWSQPAPGDYPPPPPPGQGHDNGPPEQDQGSQPSGQGSYNVPPPPGYQRQDAGDEESPEARQQDQRYSYEAERWAARNCVEQRQNNTAAGAVIGGILGAIIGGGLSRGYDRGSSVAAGAVIGGTAGAAIGHSANADNANCPPGYALRAGAEPFYPGPVYGEVLYAAPVWYDPWIWYGNHWIYRPYPYHRYWYRTHRP